MSKQATSRHFPSDDLSKFQVRMPPELREKLRQQAERERRSMNAQVCKFIEDGLKQAA